MINHQRKGAISNAHVGREFEKKAHLYLNKKIEIEFKKEFSLEIGMPDSVRKNKHRFDLGIDDSKKIIVECKAHTWTEGGNVPSAKLTVWNEAMYYFYLAPNDFRKILFVQKDFSIKKNMTLAEYYVEKYGHLIPKEVEIWEFDIKAGKHKIII